MAPKPEWDGTGTEYTAGETLGEGTSQAHTHQGTFDGRRQELLARRHWQEGATPIDQSPV